MRRLVYTNEAMRDLVAIADYIDDLSGNIETGLRVTQSDLHLFAMIAEKAYQGETHWLMFLFRCKKPITRQPPDIPEGKFGFFSREKIKGLPIPETDKAALWPIFDQYRDSFVALKADCGRSPIVVTMEQITGGAR